VSWYQKGKTNLDFTEARDIEWQWHQLGHMQSAYCSRQITTPTPHHSIFLQAGCPSCRPTNSVKALKEQLAPILMTLKVFCLFEASSEAFSYRFAVVDYISTDMVCSCSASAVAELLGLFLCAFLEEQVVNTY